MKIVVNRCFGGFGLSPVAVKELIGRGCKNIIKKTLEEHYGKGDMREYERKRSVPLGGNFRGYGGKVFDDKYVYYYAYSNSNERTDPDLIAVVEELGELANGLFAQLEVVKIPDDIEYEIDNYDGSETIREKHRTW